MDLKVYVVSSYDDPRFYHRRSGDPSASCERGHTLPHDCDGTVSLELVDGCKPIKREAYAGLGVISMTLNAAHEIMALAPECVWADTRFVRASSRGWEPDRRFAGLEMVSVVPVVRCMVDSSRSDPGRYSLCEFCGHAKARLDRKSIQMGGLLAYHATSTYAPWFVNSNGTCYTLATDLFVDWWTERGDRSLSFLEAGVASIDGPGTPRVEHGALD
jgi:hypothetical protein